MTDWIDNVFGAGQTPTVKFILLFAAIIIGVLALIFVARRLLGGTFVSGGRGRHLRLAVMDATPVDSRRRLVLVRRDDVEHLILIGGPTDVVVEQNIRIDGPREAKAAPPAVATAPAMPSPPPIPARPAPEPAPALEVSRPEPLRPTPAPVQPTPAMPRPQPATPPLAARPAPALAPAAPLPRPIQIQPPLPPLRPAPPVAAPQVAPPVTAPRPPLAPAARMEPLPTHRPDPVMSSASAAPAVAAVAAPKPLDDDLDESLMADLSESLTFDTADAVPEVSLEKEMESLLSTLDTQKDRIS